MDEIARNHCRQVIRGGRKIRSADGTADSQRVGDIPLQRDRIQFIFLNVRKQLCIRNTRPPVSGHRRTDDLRNDECDKQDQQWHAESTVLSLQ